MRQKICDSCGIVLTKENDARRPHHFPWKGTKVAITELKAYAYASIQDGPLDWCYDCLIEFLVSAKGELNSKEQL